MTGPEDALYSSAVAEYELSIPEKAALLQAAETIALATPSRTPAAALDAACHYAAARADSGNDRTLVGSAYRAIMADYPGLGKAYVLERLAGIDRLETYLAGGNDY